MAKKPTKSRKPAKRRPTRGRPEHEPTLEQRQTVEQMRAFGESEAIIAAAVGVSVPTLRKCYKPELFAGHANRRREVINLLFASARSGNVAAQRSIEAATRIVSAADAVVSRETPSAALGKKEQRQHAAESVTGKFAPPAAPKLVVSNDKS